MNLVILSLALAVSPSFQQSASRSGPAHAELHPAQADLYLAVPDVQAIVDAYGNAPVLRTVNDAPVREFLAGVSGDLAGDARTMLKGWVDRVVPDGGAMLDEMHALSLSFALDPGGEGAFGIQLVVSFATAEHAHALQKIALETGTPLGALDVPGLTGTQRFTSQALAGMELWCATIGERFVLGGGSTTVEGLAALLAGSQSGLDRSELLEQGRKTFGEGSGTTVFWILQRRSPIELLAELNQAVPLLGGALTVPYESIPSFLDPFAGRSARRMQLRGDRFVTEMFSPGGTTAGALGGQPVEAEWLQRVPAGVMFAYSTAVDGAELVPKMRELFTFLGEAETPDLEGVLAGLGPGMVTYVFPIGGIGLPQTHVWIDVDDAADFTAKVTSLCEQLAETQPSITVRTRQYKVKNKATDKRVPVPVTTITLPPGTLDLGPLSPTSLAFAAFEGKILFGLSATNVKRELKRFYNGETEGGAADPWTAHGFAVPEDARSVLLMDWGLQIEAAISLVRLLGGMFSDQIPFDLNALPAGKAFTQFLRPSFQYSRESHDAGGGTYRYHEASFGPETWLGIGGALFGNGG